MHTISVDPPSEQCHFLDDPAMEVNQISFSCRVILNIPLNCPVHDLNAYVDRISTLEKFLEFHEGRVYQQSFKEVVDMAAEAVLHFVDVRSIAQSKQRRLLLIK